MPKVRAILGHVSVETAQRKRKCARHKSGKAAHSINKDDVCLVVKDSDGFKHNYCPASAADILELVAADLAALCRALDTR